VAPVPLKGVVSSTKHGSPLGDQERRGACAWRSGLRSLLARCSPFCWPVAPTTGPKHKAEEQGRGRVTGPCLLCLGIARNCRGNERPDSKTGVNDNSTACGFHAFDHELEAEVMAAVDGC
jgi:hypothetical protein